MSQINKKTKKVLQKISKITTAILLVVSIVVLSGCSMLDYSKANKLFKSGEYSLASKIFEELGEYKDSKDKLNECNYELAGQYFEKGDIEKASSLYVELGDFKDSKEKLAETAWKAVRNYVLEKGIKNDAGTPYVNLSSDMIPEFSSTGTINFSVYASETSDSISISRIGYFYTISEGFALSYTPGSGQALVHRTTIGPINSKQDGEVDVTAFTGKVIGTMVDNDGTILETPGFTTTSSENDSADKKLTKGYQKATIDMINTDLFVVLNIAKSQGFKGTVKDLGFTALADDLTLS